MSKRASHPRRQILPDRTNASQRSLRRALWGVPPAVAEALVAERTAELQAQIRAAETLLRQERDQHARLELEVERLQRHADVLRQAVDLQQAAYRQERSHAEAARRILAAELAQMDLRHAERLQDLQFAQVHLTAEMQRSSREIGELIAALRRILSAHGRTHAGLVLPGAQPRPTGSDG